MGLFDKKNKVATTEPASTTAEVTTPPVENTTSISDVSMDNNPFVEAPHEILEEEVPAEPQVSFDNIFNASSEDLLPTVEGETKTEVMEETAATIDNPELAPNAVEALKVNPSDMIGDTTKEDEITQIISNSVDPTPNTVPPERLEPVETQPTTQAESEEALSTPEPELVAEQVEQVSSPTEVPPAETVSSEPPITEEQPTESVESTESQASEPLDEPSAQVPVEPNIENTPEAAPVTNLTEEPLNTSEPLSTPETTLPPEENPLPSTELPTEQPASEQPAEVSEISPTETIIPEEVLASQQEEVASPETTNPSEEPVLELTSNPPVEPAFVTPQESIMSSGVEESIISVPPLKSEKTTTEVATTEVEQISTEEPLATTEVEQTSTEEPVPMTEETTPEVAPVAETVEQPTATPVEVPIEQGAEPVTEPVTESEEQPVAEPAPENNNPEPVAISPENEIELPRRAENPEPVTEPEESGATTPAETVNTLSEENTEPSDSIPSTDSEEEQNRPIIEESETVILPVITEEMAAEYVAMAHEKEESSETAVIPEEPVPSHHEETILPSVEEVVSNENEIANDIPQIAEPVITEENPNLEGISEEPVVENPPITEEQPNVAAPNIISPIDQVITEEPSPIITEPISPISDRPKIPSRPVYDDDFVYPKEPTPAMIRQKQNRPQLTERDGIVAYISDPTPTRFCNNCGVMLTDDSSICPSCGEPID